MGFLILQLFVIISLSIQGFAIPTNKIKENVGSTETLFQQLHVKINVLNGYAQTAITYKVKNVAVNTQKFVVSILVPKNGVLTDFIVEVDGKNVTANRKESEIAIREFDEASSTNLIGGLISISDNKTNLYKVTINMPSQKEGVFYLSYKNAIKRRNNWAELTFDVRPEQFLKNYSVDVFINEERKIVELVPFSVDVLEVNSRKLNFESDSRPTVHEQESKTRAVVKFAPIKELQKRLGHLKVNGFSKKFIVQYEIERDPSIEKETSEFLGDGSQLLLSKFALTPGKSLIVLEAKVNREATTEKIIRQFRQFCSIPYKPGCTPFPRIG